MPRDKENPEQPALLALRVRAAVTRAMLEARQAMVHAAMRLDAFNRVHETTASFPSEAAGRARQLLADLAICRGVTDRIESFSRDLDAMNLDMDTLVEIPHDIEEILVHYLHDALDPIVNAVAPGRESAAERKRIEAWIAGREGRFARICV